MKAFVAGPAGAVAAEVARPEPGPDEVLVKVRACGLNRADLAMAAGATHGAIGGPGARLGMEWAGEIVAIGAQVEGLRLGERVMGSGSGGFAEYAVADAGRVFALPSASMSFEVAATLPVALQTMHDALITHGALQAGQSVLIQGASSGVGLMAMQIARVKGARKVIGSSTDAGRRARLHEFGADLAIDPRDPSWADQVLDATDGQGVDVVIDQVSGGSFNDTMRATRITGRIVNVGRLGGTRGEFNFDLHALRRIHYIGVTFRTRSRDEVRAITAAMRRDLWEDVAAGRLALPIDQVFTFDQLPAALQRMAANQHLGKIVVSLPG